MQMKNLIVLPFAGLAPMLAAAAFAEPLARDAAPYRVGAASVAITPDVSPQAPPVWMAGFGTARRAQSIRDDLYARAVYIDDGQFALAIVACDLIGLFHHEVQAIREELGRIINSESTDGVDDARTGEGARPRAGLDYVLVSSTHTHAGPDTLGIWGPVGRTGVTRGYLDTVRAACVRAVLEARRTARPAGLRIAVADAHRDVPLIRDSRQPIVIDSTMIILQARDTSGQTVCTLVNMACHPEVLGRGNTGLSSDFPASLRQTLEAEFGGLAIYNSSSIGGLLAPNTPREDPFTGDRLPADETGRMVAYGRILASVVKQALDGAEPLTGAIRVESQNVLIPVWNPIYRTALVLRVIQRPVYDTQGRRLRAPAPAAPASKAGPDPGDREPSLTTEPLHMKTEIALVEIGPLQIAAIPGEIYPEITLGRYQQPQDPAADFPGAELEPTVFGLMTGRYRMVIGLANDEIGYIIPKSQWDYAPPFAYGRRERQYGEINSCGPDVAPILMAAWKQIMKPVVIPGESARSPRAR